MCSVSWLLEKKGYQVFFNRDEQKSRALALPPKKYTLDGVDVLMPLDQFTADPQVASPARFMNDPEKWFYADFLMNYDPCICEFEAL